MRRSDHMRLSDHLCNTQGVSDAFRFSSLTLGGLRPRPRFSPVCVVARTFAARETPWDLLLYFPAVRADSLLSKTLRLTLKEGFNKLRFHAVKRANQ